MKVYLLSLISSFCTNFLNDGSSGENDLRDNVPMMSKVNFLRISKVNHGNREYECHGQVSFQVFGTLPAIVITEKKVSSLRDNFL